MKEELAPIRTHTTVTKRTTTTIIIINRAASTSILHSFTLLLLIVLSLLILPAGSVSSSSSAPPLNWAHNHSTVPTASSSFSSSSSSNMSSSSSSSHHPPPHPPGVIPYPDHHHGDNIIIISHSDWFRPLSWTEILQRTLALYRHELLRFMGPVTVLVLTLEWLLETIWGETDLQLSVQVHESTEQPGEIERVSIRSSSNLAKLLFTFGWHKYVLQPVLTTTLYCLTVLTVAEIYAGGLPAGAGWKTWASTLRRQVRQTRTKIWPLIKAALLVRLLLTLLIGTGTLKTFLIQALTLYLVPTILIQGIRVGVAWPPPPQQPGPLPRAVSVWACFRYAAADLLWSTTTGGQPWTTTVGLVLGQVLLTTLVQRTCHALLQDASWIGSADISQVLLAPLQAGWLTVAYLQARCRKTDRPLTRAQLQWELEYNHTLPPPPPPPSSRNHPTPVRGGGRTWFALSPLMTTRGSGGIKGRGIPASSTLLQADRLGPSQSSTTTAKEEDPFQAVYQTTRPKRHGKIEE